MKRQIGGKILMNLPREVFEKTCIQFSEKKLFVLQSGNDNNMFLTGATLLQKSKVLGSVLQEMLPQTRAVLLMPQGLEYIFTLLACWYANIVPIPMSVTDLSQPDKVIEKVEPILKDSQAACIITSTDFEKFLNAQSVFSGIRIFNIDVLDENSCITTEPRLQRPDDLALLLYTSGSTSQPKGVMLDHSNVISQASIGADQWEISQDSRIVSWMPQFHNFGLYFNILTPLLRGATSIIQSPDSFAKNPEGWLQAISQYQATHTAAPNFAFDYCCSSVDISTVKELSLDSVRAIICGGEPIRKETYENFVEKFQVLGLKKEVFCPHYGLSEIGSVTTKKPGEPLRFFSVDISGLEVGKVIYSTQNKKSMWLTGCGEIKAPNEIVVVHPETCRISPNGEVGEIWVKSPLVGKGYLNRNEETQKTFSGVLSNSKTKGFLRTGDLGFVEDNQLYIVGRDKEVIIIHGKNYHPVDIEWTIKKHVPELNLPLAVFSHEINQHEQVVVVQEVAVADETDYQRVVQEILAAVTETHQLELSEIILVSAGSIPRTGSGKIQRRACRNSYLNQGIQALYQYCRYSTDIEFESNDQAENVYEFAINPQNLLAESIREFIIKFLAETLKILPNRADPAKSVQSHGLNSIIIMKLIRGLEKNFRTNLTIREIFEQDSIQSLSNALAQKINIQNNQSTSVESIHKSQSNDGRSVALSYRSQLSEGQKGLWMLQKLSPGMSAYNVPLCFRLGGELDIEKFRQACSFVVEKHPVFRSVIIEDNGVPFQNVQPFQNIMLFQEDISSFEYSDIVPYISKKTKEPFILKNDPLIRISLLSYKSKEYFVLITIHHIIFDGSSMLLFVTALLDAYKAFLQNKSPMKVPNLAEYSDFVAWEQDMLKSREGEEHSLYWKKQLAGVLPVLELPADHARFSVQSFAGQVYTCRLPQDLVKQVKLFAKSSNMNTSVMFLGIFKLLLYHYTGQDDIIVGMPVVGRPEERFESIIGYFVNMIAVRSCTSGKNIFMDFLQKLKFTLIDGLDHAVYPFPVLVRELNIPRTLRNNPVFQVTFAYQNFFQSNGINEILGHYKDILKVEFIEEIHQEGEYELALEIYEQADEFVLNMKYNPELFEAATISRMMHHYIGLMKEVIKNPGLSLEEYSLLSEKELCSMMLDGKSNQAEYPDKCIHELFEEQVRKFPEAIAVVCGEKKLTYADLSEKSDRLAARLSSEGVCPECVVGLCMERSVELIVGILGILKAGGVYLPLEPRNPAERLKYMIQDSGTLIVLTQTELTDMVSQIIDVDTKLITLNSNEEITVVKSQSKGHTAYMTEVKPSNLAYVIYTSGSTGIPKGVMIEHKGVLNLHKYFADSLILDDSDTMAQFASISFDASAFEIFISLLSGATLCIIPQEKIDDVRNFEKYMNDNRVTIALLPPPYLANVDPEKILTLRTLITGGSEIDFKLLEKWREKVKYINAYGPTEDTIISTIWRYPGNGEALEGSTVPIGKPIMNKSAFIVSPSNNLLPVGVVGELCIAGEGLARGYLNQPALTAEKFVDNPFSPGTKLYKTGDLARWRSDGNIEFWGRIDSQVKFHGFRIELGEIETQLRSYPEINDCAVVLKEQQETKQLVAYYVRKAKTNIEGEKGRNSIKPEVLRNHLKITLPEYMIPAFFIEIESIPFTLSGKIDRKDLMNRKIELERTEEVLLPQSEIEEKILDIWKEILKIEKISTKDGFFEIGGDSILAVMAADRINRELCLDINVTELFKYSNIKDLSRYIASTGEGVRTKNTIREKYTAPGKEIEDRAVEHTVSSAEYPEYYKDSIAIIGISGSFPGAKDHYEFWENLKSGKESIEIISREELIKSGMSEERINNPNFVPVQSSMEGKDLFDPEFFSISPKDAELMDPQFRLLLLHSWRAIEDAGYVSKQIPKTSVFMTASNNFYHTPVSDEIMGDSNDYALRVFAQGGTISTMVSYKLGLNGPSLFVQTNCSSSLTGLHLAHQSLMTDDVEYALVGGCSIFSFSDTSGYMHQSGMNFSSNGHVKAFDASADGIVGGEGVVVILVKKAIDAVKDGDHIYALIRGVAVNNDGSDKVGFYAPSVKGQSEVIQKALEITGINPESISYIEAHGTGTKLGDPIELAALNDAYRRYTAKKQFCGIGSVKTNIGHLDTAAGLAGCIKIALSLHYGEIPQTLNYKTPNPNFDFDNSSFYVVDKPKKWDDAPVPWRAALSSFGIGGTNAHAIMEQFINKSALKQNEPECGCVSYLVPLSARNKERLRVYAQDMLAFLKKQHTSDLNPANLAYTLQIGREMMESRVIFVVNSLSELIDKLERFTSSSENIGNCFSGEVKQGDNIIKIFEDEEKCRELVNNWLLIGDFMKIAELWSKGINIDWKLLYADAKPSRISLPTYPFALKSYQKQKVSYANPVSRGITAGENSGATLQNGQIKPDIPRKKISKSDDISYQTLMDYVKDVIMEKLSESLKTDINALQVEQSFADYGLDSVSGINLVNLINQALPIELEVTCLFDYSSVNQLSEYILSCYKGPVSAFLQQNVLSDNETNCGGGYGQTEYYSTESITRTKIPLNTVKTENNDYSDNPAAKDAIAIIGISGRFAKSETVNELWENVSNGVDLVDEVTRWDLSKYYSKDDKYCRYGSFLCEIDRFDPLFFNISGFEATYMDPQQRIFLEESWRALEDSGYAGIGLQERKCGVYVGCAAGDYQELLGDNLPPQAIWGNMSSVIPTRIAYYLDLHGPVIAVDTACSSSLVAIHLACQSLWAGENEMALAGGVFIQCTPKNFLAANRGNMLSPTGRCHSFAEKADGFILGEGAGVVVLKRLNEAISDGDHIYGVIRGSAINQDGTTNGITAPSANSQERLERYVYDTFNIHPEQIQMIEAHGSGTKLGDPIEFQALTRAFRHYTAKKGYCAIGTIKTNIGHTQLASGIAGVLKILLSLKHKKIPPSLHFESGNSNIRFEESPFYVNTRLQDWETEPNSKRCAAVSSFGFSGTNAHIVIEEAPEVYRGHSEKSGYLIVLSARTYEQLKQQAEQLVDFCEHDTSADCGNMSYTLLLGRKHFNHRLACVAKNSSELAALLKKWLEKGKVPQVYVSELLGNDHRKQTALKRYGNQCIIDCTDMEKAGDYLENLATIADLYIQGYRLEFEQLFSDGQYSRISLPTYPFAQEHYWGVQAEDKLDGSKNDTVTAEHIHPLLHQNTSGFSGLRYSSNFTGREFFLNDHVVNGENILPGAAYLEMVRTAIAEAVGVREPEQAVIRLKNVVWARPISVKGNAIRIHVGLLPGENGEIAYKVYSEQEEQGAAPVVYSEGLVGLNSSADVHTLDLRDLQSKYREIAFSPDRFYKSLQTLGVNYGNAYQAVKAVYTGPEQILIQLELPSVVSDTLNKFVLHPSLVDAAFQSMSLMLSTTSNLDDLKPSLLFALQELEVTGRCTSSMWALIRYNDGNVAGDKMIKYDIDLYDEQGKLCVRMKKVSTKAAGGKVEAASTPKAVASGPNPQLVGNITLIPVWDSVQAEKAQTLLNSSESVLLIGGTEEIAEKVGGYYQSVSVPDIKTGESIECIAQKLADFGPVENLIWVCPQDSLQSVSEDTVIEGQSIGVLQVFRMIKALLSLGYDAKALNWTFITIQTQPVHKNDRVNPTHASLHGLIGSMAKEYSNWKVRLVDLEAGCDWPLEDILSLTPDVRGNPLVYRGQQWYRQQLVQADNMPQEQTLYRNEGVYVVIGGAGSIGEAWSECMIRTYKAKIVWIGRREKDAEIQAKIDRLAALGSEPVYIAADATKQQSLQQAYEEIKRQYPQVHGVVHSAQVFLSGSLSKIEETVFRSALESKVNVCVHLAQVFQKESLDFMLFFSSINSYLKAPGQSPYSSGCVFKDAFVHQLAQEWPCAVRVINWGYFFNNAKDRERLEQAGIGLIEPEEAAAALDKLLAGPMTQMSFVKTTSPLGMRGMSLSKDLVTIYPKNAALDIRKVHERTIIPELPVGDLEKTSLQMKEMDGLLYKLLWGQLQANGLFERNGQSFNDLKAKAELRGMYDRWLEESVRLLVQQNFLIYKDNLYTVRDNVPVDMEVLWEEWEHKKISWWENPEMKAQAVLVEKTLRALPEIIKGKKLATEVMFPGSSLEFVEAVYKNNMTGHYFNEVLANTVVAYVEERLAQDPQVKLSIMELGAGTGGTSVVVFEKLRPYKDYIEEYCYTDISRAFLIHAEKEYSQDNPYLTCKMFNVEKPVVSQDIDGGKYDIVIAANVLHATGNIRETIRNAKAVLKENGFILLNEISSNNLFSHLTFGLLDGWWMYEDPILRIPGCPGLATETWWNLLEQEGFHSFFLPYGDPQEFLQQIIAAQSNGVVRQRIEDANNKDHIADGAKIQAKQSAGSDKTLDSAINKEKKPDSSNANQIESHIKQTIAQKMSESLKVDIGRIDYDESLSDYGLDSIIAVNLVRVIGQALAVELEITIMFEYNTINQLTDFILTKYGDIIGSSLKLNTAQKDLHETEAAAAQVNQLSSGYTMNWIPKIRVLPETEYTEKEETQRNLYGQDAIAVIGISGRFPMADNPDEYWNNLIEGKDCISEIPQERWEDWRKWYSDYQSEMEAMKSKRGGFINGISEFDPLFFGITPKEAEFMCPEQRLLLTYIWRAIEDAGITSKVLSRNSTGVFIASALSEYKRVKITAGSLDNPGLVANPSPSMIANRISYILNLSGPSECCETGCSSALVALHRAIQSINNNECEQAVVGAVNLLLSPIGFISLESANLLSVDGRAKSFQKDADGFVRSEGVGAVIIKPLSKAIADHDNIYAVIKGTAVAHGGKGVSLFAPNAAGMKNAMIQAYRTAEVDPRTVSYIEAHGIGAALADSIEIGALKSGYYELIASNKEETDISYSTCYISSLKPSIGHGEIFSGMAALIKAILAIRNGVIPGLHRFTALNEDISLEGSPFQITDKNHGWEETSNTRDGKIPRRASINSFGLGGVNAHLVLEEYIPDKEEIKQLYSENSPQIIVFSAKSKERLAAAVGQMLEFVESQESLHLPDLAYTLQVGREAMSHRLAMVVSSKEDLKKGLRWYISTTKCSGQKNAFIPMFESEPEEQRMEICGLFSGKIGDILLQALLAENDFEKLALYWAKGNDLPWDMIHEGKRVRRIAIPTYPFGKRRYWIGSQPSSGEAAGKDELIGGHNSCAGEKYATADRVTDILSRFLGMKPAEMNLNISLEQYGIESILLMPLLQQLQTRIDPSVSLTGLQKCRTIQDIINMVSASASDVSYTDTSREQNRYLKTAVWPQFPELVRLNESVQGQPIFWIHGALGGVEAYKLIAQNCKRPFFGIQARGWMTEHPPLHGIQAMAGYYVQIIQSVQPEGPYDLGGFCMGGILAYEITRQLQERGQIVNSIVMLDSPDNTFQESLAGFNKNAYKNIIFQTVNMMLLSSILQQTGKTEQKLIHQGELDISADDEAFFEQLIKLAQIHGLSKTVKQLDVLVGQNVKVQLAYELDKYKILPLFDSQTINCYYFRNKSGLFEGDLKPYLTVSDSEFSFDNVNYWQEWERQFTNFKMFDVDAPNHMMLLNEIKSVTPIVEFCTKLYSGQYGSIEP
ncbi:MAG: amino acid adenylation domain-containing protein [Clostridia bacterium]|nr:amino acid adenylation domain-containing protein [Clostridia bacterium]